MWCSCLTHRSSPHTPLKPETISAGAPGLGACCRVEAQLPGRASKDGRLQLPDTQLPTTIHIPAVTRRCSWRECLRPCGSAAACRASWTGCCGTRCCCASSSRSSTTGHAAGCVDRRAIVSRHTRVCWAGCAAAQGPCAGLSLCAESAVFLENQIAPASHRLLLGLAALLHDLLTVASCRPCGWLCLASQGSSCLRNT